MNKKIDYNYNDNSNLGIRTDKSSTKEELTTTPTNEEEVNKDMAENSTNNSENYKIQQKDESIKDKIYTKMSEVGSTKRRGKESTFNIKSIIFGLFALIGFIILVYSIFVALVSEPLASIADTVFVAALIGSFIMVGVIVSYSFLKK
jgi:ABC-type multidrug transport system fused ATPase/permease subunit